MSLSNIQNYMNGAQLFNYYNQYSEPELSGSNTSHSICEVWATNLFEEFRVIRSLVQTYNYIALDTEFPGTIARPVGEFKNPNDYNYQLLRCNVDLSKVIQIGFTFFDSNGKPPEGFTTWQFNFTFNLDEDMFAEDAIELLERSGVQFERLSNEGIDTYAFAELLMSSGIILSEEVKWISFHGGYDFAHLLKLLTVQNLPPNMPQFIDLLNLYFPITFDIKYIMNKLEGFIGGLQDISNQFELKIIGRAHQAGSDSFVSGAAFFKLRDHYFNGIIDETKYSGRLFGLDFGSNETPFN